MTLDEPTQPHIFHDIRTNREMSTNPQIGRAAEKQKWPECACEERRRVIRDQTQWQACDKCQRDDGQEQRLAKASGQHGGHHGQQVGALLLRLL